MAETVKVCESCGDLFDITRSACPNCGIAAISASNLDPMQAIETEGRLFSRAMEGRPKPIVLLGIWVIFFPGFVLGMYLALNAMVDGSGDGFRDFVIFWVGAALAVVSLILLGKITRNFFVGEPVTHDIDDDDPSDQAS